MKKIIFALMAIMMLSILFVGCSKSPIDSYLDNLESFADKLEKAADSSDYTAALSLMEELATLQTESYSLLEGTTPSEAQEDRFNDLMARIGEVASVFDGR